ncbi:hypothetical protein GIB67_002014 [Kingdonia uniflora]|uniref:Uncharacterized protein n=1 Tax=Kingdonia uniflora TaxID=39325 RepID=A0A7J7MA13_9MAGN|nr:hypothetical protein GIB67_002014 [Kingdonia uniflora]
MKLIVRSKGSWTDLVLSPCHISHIGLMVLGDIQGDQALQGDKASQGGHFPLEFDDNGSIIGEYRTKFATKCGELVKKHVYPIIRDWHLVEKENPGLKVKRTHQFMPCHKKADGTFPEPIREKMEVFTTVVQNLHGFVDEIFYQDDISNSGCSPFGNAYCPSMPVLPRSCELLDLYGVTVAYRTLQQGGRASRDFNNKLIYEIVHVIEGGPLDDVVAGEIIVWEKFCTVFI